MVNKELVLKLLTFLRETILMALQNMKEENCPAYLDRPIVLLNGKKRIGAQIVQMSL